MILSQTEIREIIRGIGDGNAPLRSGLRVEMRRMLDALADFEFQPKRATPLVKLCTVGADYGWRQLQKTAKPNLLLDVSSKAKASLRRDLQRRLEQITRPCLELERRSFEVALNSIDFPAGRPDPKRTERMFLGEKPADRLFSLFKGFPVLAGLWCQSICQWCDHVIEVLSRFARDRQALSRIFLSGRRMARIEDLRCGLSDSHNNGRTVVQLLFATGSIIYKPRSGAGEREWFSLLEWMNTQSFQPKLRAARISPRQNYCWMECIEAAPCKNQEAARRFYRRMGGMIAAAHLLKAVDCHRDNIIASRAYPMLVDVDALWHVSPLTKTQSLSDVFYRTGFFPDSNRRGLQSRSSALGPGTKGNHLPRIAGKPLKAAHYQSEIVSGFTRAWRCILGTENRRSAFARRLRRVRSQERRWIYWATEKYAAIREASLQPGALRSGSERDSLIRRLCTREIVTSVVIDAEILALKRLDIPYFVRKSNEQMPPDRHTAPLELIRAIQRALQF